MPRALCRSAVRLAAAAALALPLACSRHAVRPADPPLRADAPLAAAQEAARRDPQTGPALSLPEMIDHALSRFTFGPRPGDRERVAKLGLAAFFEEQLHPEHLRDDAAQASLARYRPVSASPAEMMESLLDRRRQRREGMAMEEPAGPGGPIVGELAQAKLVRAVASERQLLEVMADFWFNHFNVYGAKGRVRALLPSYERDVIRRHALGSFRELLLGTARHPAMLVYLDNWRSSSPEPPARVRRARRRPKRPARRGLNENYARELLELHTLGVDGGYTQADVTEVARCFTGWTVAGIDGDPRFAFRLGRHDGGEKRVLGTVIEAGGGEGDGEAVLEMLMRHPSTARFIATKLVRRFVADDPPLDLVERVAGAFSRTGGEVRAMLRAIFASPDFWSRRALRAKVRSPLEHVVASVRALGAAVGDAVPLARAVARIGEPLYGAAAPTGYPDTADAWVSPGALLARIDFGLALAEGKLRGVSVDLAPLAAAEPERVLQGAQVLLGTGDLSPRTRSFVLEKLREAPAKARAARAVGLLLGAPEVQRR